MTATTTYAAPFGEEIPVMAEIEVIRDMRFYDPEGVDVYAVEVTYAEERFAELTFDTGEGTVVGAKLDPHFALVLAETLTKWANGRLAQEKLERRGAGDGS